MDFVQFMIASLIMYHMFGCCDQGSNSYRDKAFDDFPTCDPD